MNKFRKRAVILLAGITVWALIIIGRLFFYTVYASQHYVQKGNKQAWRKGIVQATRGRILDKNGVPLAWTEKYFDLFYNGGSQSHFENMKKKIAAVIKDSRLLQLAPNKYCVKRDLAPDELIALSQLIPHVHGLYVLSRVKRRVVDYPEVRAYIGNTDIKKNIEHGISGVEARFDSRLCGENGEYIVMLDRAGDWIPGSYRVIKETVDGSDVTLTNVLEDLGRINNEK